MPAVDGFTGAGDEDIVQIDESKRQAAEQGVHKPLNGHARVLQTKRHADKFEQAERCYYGHLGDVTGSDGACR
jgi:hypothetical protein